MVTLDLKIQLPNDLLKEAESAGLLTPDAIEQLLRKEIQRQRIDKLFDSADRLADLNLPALSQEEVEAEIAALRTVK
jgi:post-segregation antitoxin (ccd killing protein)